MENKKLIPSRLRSRFIALLLDFLVIVCFAVILLGINLFVFFFMLGGIPNFNEFQQNLLSFFLLIPVVIASIYSENRSYHAIFGKRKNWIDCPFNCIRQGSAETNNHT